MTSLVKFWSECDLRRAPYVHPRDLSVIRSKFSQLFDFEVRTPQQFVSSARFGNSLDNRFHLALMPVPYVGRLATADIFILLLNPSVSASSYLEEADAEHREALKRNLRQVFAKRAMAFKSLDPEFCWTGGFRWWEGKLRSVISARAVETQTNYLSALKELSARLACVELVPYRSGSFNGGKLIGKLPSSVEALKYVDSVLKPRARAGEIKIIVTRKVEEWGLRRGRNVVLYEGGQTRGASLGPHTPGGRAILAQLRKPWPGR